MAAAAVAVASLAATAPAPAATLVAWVDSVQAYRSVSVCAAWQCLYGYVAPLPDSAPVSGDVPCVAAMATDAAGNCWVVVSATVDGFAPRNAMTTVAVSFTHADGAPWTDPVRRKLWTVPGTTSPAAPGAPVVCAVESPGGRVPCGHPTRRAWTVTQKVRAASGGMFSARVWLAFRGSGIDRGCESFRVAATVTAGRLRTVDQFGTTELCA